MDDTTYRPAPHVLERLKDIDFVAVVGPTAAGKTTLIKKAAAQEPNLHMLVTGTSRPMREGEQEGVDFYFGNKAEMQVRTRRREYITVVRGSTGDIYTTAPENYPVGKTAVLAVFAHAISLFRSLPYRTFRTIFVLPQSYETWQARLNQRAFPPEELARRLREAETSLRFAAQDDEIYFVLNGDIETATTDFTALALGQTLSPRLQETQGRGRVITEQLLAGLRGVHIA